MKIHIRVKTHKKQKRAYWEQDDLFGNKKKILIVETTESPIDGKANRSVIKIVANFFDVSKSEVSIKSGHTSKNKTVIIQEE